MMTCALSAGLGGKVDRGYVKLWRKSFDSGLMDEPALWLVWCWCLLKAQYKPTKKIVHGQMVDLQPGQFIYTRRMAAKELPLSPQQIRLRMNRLKSNQQITHSPTQHYTVVTIINWRVYQQEDLSCNPQSVSKRTQDEPTTNPPLIYMKNRKNSKKGGANEEQPSWKPKIDHLLEALQIPAHLWGEFKKMRTRIKKPITEYAEYRALKYLAEANARGWKPTDLLNNAIDRPWRFPFAPDHDEIYGQQAQGKDDQAERKRLKRLQEEYYAKHGYPCRTE